VVSTAQFQGLHVGLVGQGHGLVGGEHHQAAVGQMLADHVLEKGHRRLVQRREGPRRQILVSAQAHALQGIPGTLLVHRDPGQLGGDAQVLDAGQIPLDGALVPGIEQIPVERLPRMADVLALPAHLARRRGNQAERESQPGKEPAIAANAFQINDFEHGDG